MNPVIRDRSSARLDLLGAQAFKDNRDYLDRVNQSELEKVFVRPATTVVLSQDPAAGTQVPLGTQINLTLVAKGDIPTKSIGVVAAVADKWAFAEDVIVAVDTSGDAVKGVFAKNVDYANLAKGDKAVVDGFLRQQLGDVDIAAAYGDIGFIYGL
jgi:hypothetical protein